LELSKVEDPALHTPRVDDRGEQPVQSYKPKDVEGVEDLVQFLWGSELSFPLASCLPSILLMSIYARETRQVVASESEPRIPTYGAVIKIWLFVVIDELVPLIVDFVLAIVIDIVG
jgi:hypothetical protein